MNGHVLVKSNKWFTLCCVCHTGLSAPVPRGRKGKKNKKEPSPKYSAFEEELSKLDFDPETVLIDEGYKKHLKRHANK